MRTKSVKSAQSKDPQKQEIKLYSLSSAQDDTGSEAPRRLPVNLLSQNAQEDSENSSQDIYQNSIKNQLSKILVRGQLLAIILTITIGISSFIVEYYVDQIEVENILISQRKLSLNNTGVSKGSTIQSLLQLQVNQLEI